MDHALAQRPLGSMGLHSSLLAFGAMGLSGVYGAADDHQSIALLRTALDKGVTMFDTADVYGNGHSESLMGEAFEGMRQRVVIATKTGEGADSGRGRPDYIRQAVEESLRRLKTDYIDLYYLHRVDPATPIEDSIGAMSELVTAGKVRYIGISEVGPKTIRRAHATHPISAVQQEYSLFVREAETEVLPTLRELGIGLVAYAPIGRGLLSGALKHIEDVENWKQRKARYPRFADNAFRANVQRVEKMRQIATDAGTTPAALALAWLLQSGPDIVPIFGTRGVAHLEENLRAASLALDARTVSRLTELFPVGALAGARYNEAALKRIDR